MGGFGSGRPSGSGRGTVEANLARDVNRLQREGCLRAGWMGGYTDGNGATVRANLLRIHGEDGADANHRQRSEHQNTRASGWRAPP